MTIKSMIERSLEITSNSKINLSWLESLAIEEINMDETGIVKINEHLDPSIALEAESIQFMDKLREVMEVYTNHFNQLRGDQLGQIKIFKIANTVNDFMLFRNSLRLLFTRKNNDRILIGFLSGNKELIGPRINSFQNQMPGDSSAPHELKAHVGPYNKIKWLFFGEDIEIPSMAKFYLTEFIKNSSK
jgi:hypothetical protein